MEGRDEPFGNEVEELLLLWRQVGRMLPCGDDGMVVGDLRGVEHPFAFLQGG